MNNYNEFFQALLTWENLLQLATLFLFYFGLDSQIVNAVNKIKELLGAKDKQAEIILVTFVVLTTLATLFVQNVITPEALNPENMIILFATILYAAQKRYHRIKNKKLEDFVLNEE